MNRQCWRVYLYKAPVVVCPSYFSETTLLPRAHAFPWVTTWSGSVACFLTGSTRTHLDHWTVNTVGISLCLDPHSPSGRLSLGLKGIWLRHAHWAEKKHLDSKSGACNPPSFGENDACGCGGASNLGNSKWKVRTLNEAHWPWYSDSTF